MPQSKFKIEDNELGLVEGELWRKDREVAPSNCGSWWNEEVGSFEALRAQAVTGWGGSHRVQAQFGNRLPN